MKLENYKFSGKYPFWYKTENHAYFRHPTKKRAPIKVLLKKLRSQGVV